MGRVMLVGGEGARVSTLAGFLRMAGYEAIEQASGSAALQTLAGESVDVVVTELSLPDISAIDILRSPHRPSATRVIVLAAAGTATLRGAVTAMHLGAADVLEQPIAAADL